MSRRDSITIKVGSIDGNNRVRAGKLHIDVSRIKRVLAWQHKLYIEYLADNPDDYKQYIEEPPPYAVELQHRIETRKAYVCNICGSEIEWDAEEPYCPNGCDRRRNWSWRVEERKRLVIETPKDEIKQFVEKAFKVPVERVAVMSYTASGGCRPAFSIPRVDVGLYKASVTGLGVVENPTFVCSDYDSPEVEEERFEGRYIAVRVSSGLGSEVWLFKPLGEPDLSVMRQLHEEFATKERAKEEEIKRIIEEMKKKEKSKEWSANEAIEAIKAAIPSWADGAVVVVKSCYEDACDYYVYPVKKSQYGDYYYYSPNWRTLAVRIPSRILEKLVDHVILKNGKVVKAKVNKKSSAKYVTIETLA
jgi:hypothetical protein